MNTADVRERLYDYIRVADDKKVKAIYMMLEDEITEELKWWEDNSIVKELDKRYNNWAKDNQKGYSVSDIEATVSQMRKRHLAK
ncbi:MAG TPA: hypothetical protein PKA77_16700 [Chitinophagaceae bacterium]|jgi:hypothetical protein|nr:hypothetical protein [Chitinophagaceae bacterium]HMU59797.1 hypothetical protein [Chitinophagaceae bacterium]